MVEKGEFGSIMVCGDFNFPGIVWSDDGDVESVFDSNCMMFIEGIEDAILSQYIRFPTFETSFGIEGNV